jgi:hypothetical protein
MHLLEDHKYTVLCNLLGLLFRDVACEVKDCIVNVHHSKFTSLDRQYSQNWAYTVLLLSYWRFPIW